MVEEQVHEEGDSAKAQETEMNEAAEASNNGNRLVTMEEDKAEDMDLSDLDLEALKVECMKVGSGYVPQEQIECNTLFLT